MITATEQMEEIIETLKYCHNVAGMASRQDAVGDRCCAAITTAQALLDKLREEEWQSMDSAPKDGTPILGYCQGDITVIAWNKYGKYWNLTETGTQAEDGEWFATHWRSLPPKPQEKP